MTCVAVCALQRVTACCSVSTFVAVCVDVGALVPYEKIIAVCCSVLQCVRVFEVFCSVVQCVWMWECWSHMTSLSQCVAVCCLLQRFAVCYSARGYENVGP